MPIAQGQTLMKKAVALTWRLDSAHSEGGFEATGDNHTQRHARATCKIAMADKNSPDQTAYIRRDHILNGEVKTLKDGTKVGSGGNYIPDPNIKIDKVTGAPDANGVSTGYISVRDPATGQWVNKKAETTFFPEQWSKRQTAQEIENAFKNSSSDPFDKNKWQGVSSSGVKIQGYYGKPGGTGATAWSVYGGDK